MAEPYWRYPDGRMAAAYQQPPSGAPLKRQRSDYTDSSGGHEFPGYAPREEDRNARFVIRDTDSIGASYDHYLRNGQVPGYGAGESARPVPSVLANRPVDGPRVQGMPNMDSRGALYGVGRSEPPLPPDASNTLFVEGLPANCSRREVSHIFRPFVGFREVRLVNKESRHPGGEPLVLCFVDFANPNQAAVALEALQGYKFDEHDRESANLRLQFARFPGPRSAGGPRGRR